MFANLVADVKCSMHINRIINLLIQQNIRIYLICYGYKLEASLFTEKGVQPNTKGNHVCPSKVNALHLNVAGRT